MPRQYPEVVDMMLEHVTAENERLKHREEAQAMAAQKSRRDALLAKARQQRR